MLLRAPKSPIGKLFDQLRRALLLRPAHPVADIRELSPYLRDDIGVSESSFTFRCKL